MMEVVEFESLQEGDIIRPVERPQDFDVWMNILNKIQTSREKRLVVTVEGNSEQHLLRCKSSIEWYFERRVPDTETQEPTQARQSQLK